MVSQNQSSQTARFLDPWPWFSLIAAGAMFYSILISFGLPETLLSTRLTVKPESQGTTTQPFNLNPDRLGSLRVDAKANIPAGRWLNYEIQLRDAQGKTLAAVTKPAWRESGTWSEGGESGTWDEADVRGALDIRTQQTESVTAAIAILDYTNTAGQALDQAVDFSLTIKDGVVDRRYLWPGLVGTTLMSLLTFFATGASGKRMIVKAIDDSEVSDRAILGGPDNLVRVNVEVKGDETSPKTFQIRLKIRDGNGQLMEVQNHDIDAIISRDSDGNIDHTTVTLTQFFQFESLNSYGFTVAVEPDAPIDRTELKVCQNARTYLPVQATTLASQK